MFYMKSYFRKASLHSWLFLLALIPAILYLALAASRPDRFTITQKIKIPPEAPLALSGSPADYANVSWFLVHQDALFQDGAALQALDRELQRELAPDYGDLSGSRLYRTVRRTMSLSFQNDLLQVTYKGADQDMGRLFAGFFAGRVLKKAEEGARRQELAGQLKEESQAAPGPVQLTGDLTIAGQRALWRSDRLPAALLLLAGGIAAVLILIGFLEISDTSLKSERQVARFLHLPVLGSVPNVTRLSKVLHVRP